MSFEELKAGALAAWQDFNGGDRPRILIGTASCGRAAGALEVLEQFKGELVRQKLKADIMQVGCLGLCYAEPLVAIRKPGKATVFYAGVTPAMAATLVRDCIKGNKPHPELALGTLGEPGIKDIPALFDLDVFKLQKRLLLKNCGLIDPLDISHYIASGGYAGLCKTLGMKPADVIAEVKASGLRGRGGAGFPTGLKWEFCCNAPGAQKYFICNADEGDPGTFVDRTLMESDPHSVLEGLIIGGYAVGASMGYIYIRDEYPLAAQTMQKAVDAAQEAGLLGDGILGSGFSFRVEIRRGAGAFVCGEETALINSIEGKCGLPRVRPPFPARKGLWDQPTNVNNVETLANIPFIMQNGGQWYASIGFKKSTGTKLFSLSGTLQRPGVVEVPFGITLGQLIAGPGGGLPEGKKLKALQPGGAMLGLMPAGFAGTPIDFETLAEIGSGVGSGGMVAIDESACMVDTARLLMKFCDEESCGKCMPGYLGVSQMLAILNDITHAKGQTNDPELLAELGDSMIKGTLCPLCGGAPNPVLSTLKHYAAEYEAHIQEHRCPAGVCRMATEAGSIG